MLKVKARDFKFFLGQDETSRGQGHRSGKFVSFRFQYEIPKCCGSFGHEIRLANNSWPNVADL